MTPTNATPAIASAAVFAMAPRQLAFLAQGFAFLFWGAFALIGVGIESLLSGRPRAFIVVIGLVGVLGTALGAWRLRQMSDLGPQWRRATGLLLVTGLATAYLTLFAWLWLQVPANCYLLCHALGWMAVFLCHLAVANYCVYVLGGLLASRTLARQGALYAVAVMLMLFVPFLVLAGALLQTALTGVNSLGQLQHWMSQVNLAPYLLFFWLTPLSLTMSLIWTAQDVVWERLTAPPADNTLAASP